MPSTEGFIDSNSRNDIIETLQNQIQMLTLEKSQYENELQTYKRQQVHYQQQIAESDALLRDLRTRESDSFQILSVKDSQIASLRVRLTETDELLQRKTSQYEQLEGEYSRLLNNSLNIPFEACERLQYRITQLEKELDQNMNENERLNNDNQQLLEQIKSIEKRLNDEHLQLYEQQQQQKKRAEDSLNQLEYEMNEYKCRAQRILQSKEKIIVKLKEILQNRNAMPINGNQQG